MQIRRSDSSVKTLLALVGSGVLLEALIILLATLLRLWALDLKPAHFDEGINGWFVDQMKVSGFYRYDPENYHGPLYFYVLFVFLSLLGRNLWALRLPALLASIASVWMALRFDRFFGSTAARLGALALAVSPAAVFYGRYAIHESLFVASLMITVFGLLGLWKDGRRRDLAITSSGVTLLLLLKETAVIHLVCFVLAAGCLALWQRIVPSRPAMPLAKQGWSSRDLLTCYAASVLVLVFFYSGTFMNWHGAIDFFKAYIKWFQTGTSAGGHVKTDCQIGQFAFLNWYWLALMARYEWPTLMGLLYAVRLAWPAPAQQRYLAIYGLGVLIAYSIVPYKTPWCIISILGPLLLLFGCVVEELWQKTRFRLVVALLTAVLLAASLLVTLRLNFRHCTDPKEPYVYVQTQPGMAVVTEPVLGMAARDPRNHAMSGDVLIESYYPLPWIFGEFTRIGYYGKDHTATELTSDFIIAMSAQKGEVEKKLREPYLRRSFQLRDSMEECTIWFREALFAPWFAEKAHGSVERVVPEQGSTQDKKGVKS
ncbi:MAG: TIGR03663 family protein [Verrucomicrobia bacterium]|nr:TIGR03663 family protein [Verrucomicrobiota bacterium]